MTRTRRNAIVTTLTILASLLGCKSDSSGPDDGGYYLRFRANGEQVSYTLQSTLFITFSNSGSQYLGVVTGYDAVTNANLQIYAASTIVPDTYSGYTVSGNALTGALIGYEDASGVLFTSGGGTVDASITLDDLTATSARGRFSGTLRAAGHPDLIVTQGEFHVARLN